MPSRSRRQPGRHSHRTAQQSQAAQPSTTGPGFINPYNFVRVACFAPHRTAPRTHEKFFGLSGRITCELENLTPLCLPDSDASRTFKIQSGPYQGDDRWRKEFSRLSDGTLYLAGSSIKGMLRSVAEAASNSCFPVLTDDLAILRDNRSYVVNHRRLGRLVKPSPDTWGMQDIHPDDGTPPAEPRNPVQIWNARKNLYEQRCGEIFPDPESHVPEPSDIQERFNRDNGSFRWYRFLRGTFGDTERRDYDRNGRPLVVRRGRQVVEDRRPETPERREGEPVLILWPVAEERTTPQCELGTNVHDQYEQITASEGFRRFHNEEVRLRGWQREYLNADEEEIFWYRRHRNSRYSKVVEFGRNFRYKWAYDPRLALDPACHPCRDPESLCPCCQMFGMVRERAGARGEVNAIAGKISVSPGRWTSGTQQTFWIDDPKILGTPKHSCRSFYLESDSGSFLVGQDEYAQVVNGEAVPNPIRGRKLYWHHTQVCDRNWTEQQWRAYLSRRDKPTGTRPPETAQNPQVESVLPGARFTFTIDFENLSSFELGLLLWALALPDVPEGAYHLGLGKPIGLGSVALRIRRIQLMDRKARYESVFATGITVDVGSDPHDANATIDINAAPFSDYLNYFRSQMETWSGGTVFTALPNIADLSVILSRSRPAQATLPSHLAGAPSLSVPITYPPGPANVNTGSNDPHPEELHYKWFGQKGWSERLLTIQEIAQGYRQRLV